MAGYYIVIKIDVDVTPMRGFILLRLFILVAVYGHLYGCRAYFRRLYEVYCAGIIHCISQLHSVRHYSGSRHAELL